MVSTEQCKHLRRRLLSYVSFACLWAFAELKKMEGNAKLLNLLQEMRMYTWVVHSI